MALLLKNNVVFLHIPKTGGSWVTKVLKENDLVLTEFSHPHADLERVNNFSGHYIGHYLKLSVKFKCNFENLVNDSLKFCFVRDPISWYESVWRYYSDHNWKKFTREKNPSRFGLKYDLWHPWSPLEELNHDTFENFINDLIKLYPGYLTHLYNSYVDKRYTHYVGKQENLIEDLISILKELDLKFNKDKIIKSTKENTSKSQKPLWDEIQKNEIKKLEYQIYNKFQY
jgi:hypothetical protein